MTIEEQVRSRYNLWFNDNKKGILEDEKGTNKLIRDFLNKFTVDKIKTMSLDDYIVGKANRDTFCYWVETALKSAGGIHGSSSYKFGVFYSKEKKDYEVQTPKYNSNAVVAFEEIRDLILNLIVASQNHDIDSIARSKLSNMFKNKIAYLYNQDGFLPIYSSEDIQKLLAIFGLSIGDSKESIEKKKDRLFNFYKSLDIPECTPLRFMWFVYNLSYGYRRELRDEDVTAYISNKNKIVDIETVGNLEDLFNERDYTGRKSVYNPDPDREIGKILTGRMGEEKVISYFEAQKAQLGIVEIKYYCKKDSPEANDLAGCDIEYVTTDGQHWYVEIKSTSKNNNGRELFYMSDVEYNKMVSNREHYCIYYFNDVFNGRIVKKIKAESLIGKEHPIKYMFDLKNE